MTEIVYSYDDLYGVLDQCLEDIFLLIKPLQSDQTKRLCIINELTALVRSIESLRGIVVRPFGSFISELYTKWGDLDISIDLSYSSPSFTARKQKQNVLRDIMRVLRRSGVACKINFIPNARVPLLVYESNRQNVSCDISVDNQLGYIKSRIFKWIAEIDERFHDMVLLTKEWAKVQNINNPKSGTLNSYSLCLLVVFHFQTCEPAILPPLKDIFEGNIVDMTGSWYSLERLIEDTCAANIARFKSGRKNNQSTLSELLVSFFSKFWDIHEVSSEFVICTYTGQRERIRSNPRWMERSHKLFIEDPFEQPDNAARAVSLGGLINISEAFKNTFLSVTSKYVHSDRNALLVNLVRPSIVSELRISTRNQTDRGKGSQESHSQIAFSGLITHAPVREPNFKVRMDGDGRSSSSAVTRQRQGPGSVHVQQVWMPRSSNR